MKKHITDRIIISGLSGSGKSVALQSLEDIGYYCIDNLPPVLLYDFSIKLIQDIEYKDVQLQGAAVSIDSRNKRFLSRLNATLAELDDQGVHYRVLFLESEEQQLVKRYSETRRKHPLTDPNTPLIEGIRQERELLRPLLNQAEKVIDTTDITPHELRSLVRDFASGALSSGPLLLVESFSFKHGTPREADFVFDVRCLPNPYWDEALRYFTGLDLPVQDFLSNKYEVPAMINQIFDFLNGWLPGFFQENRSYITVAIGCTGGRHRSVYISERLYEMFQKQSINVQIRHRELSDRVGSYVF